MCWQSYEQISSSFRHLSRTHENNGQIKEGGIKKTGYMSTPINKCKLKTLRCTNTKYTYKRLKEGCGASIQKKASYAMDRTLFFIDVRQRSQQHAHTAIRYANIILVWASIILQNGCLAIPTQINPNHKGVVMVCTRLAKWLVADIRFSNWPRDLSQNV